jgi:hypothetical protein
MGVKYYSSGGKSMTLEDILEMEELLLLKREVMIEDLVSVCSELRSYYGFTDDELRDEYDEWLLREGGFADHMRVIELFYDLMESIISEKDENKGFL